MTRMKVSLIKDQQYQSDVSMPGQSWRRLKFRSRVERWSWSLALHVLLLVISLPIIILFTWMIVYAFSPANLEPDVIMIRVVSALVIIFLGVLISLSPLIKYVARFVKLRLVSVILGIVFAYILWSSGYFTIGNFSMLWDRSALTPINISGYGSEQFPSVWSAIGNSLLLAIVCSFIVVIICTGAGYYISRHMFPGRKHAFSLMLILHAFPIVTLLVPIFLMMNWLELVDTRLGVILILCALELPFGIFVMKGFFDAIPWTIEMSAMVDGASRTGAFFRVLLPQVRGGMLAIGFFGFLRGWEEYIFVQSLISTQDNWTMSQFVFFITDDFVGSLDLGAIFAIGFIYLLPSVIFYLIASRQIERMSFDGAKG